MSNNDIGKSSVYVPNVPDGAKLNFGNNEQEPPDTEYEARMKIFDLDAVKKIVGGKYGEKANKKK